MNGSTVMHRSQLQQPSRGVTSDEHRRAAALVARINDDLDALTRRRGSGSPDAKAPPPAIEILMQLTELRAFLCEKFASESGNDYWANLLASNPELEEVRRQVQGEHARLLALIDEVIDSLPTESAATGWPEVDQRFLKFAWLLAGYDSRQNRLFQQIHCQDVGTVD